MLPETRPRRALILGMGGGTIANLLLEQFGPIPIIGVEIDPRVIRLALSAFGLEQQPSVTIAEHDALEYVTATSEVFDYVAVDLFRNGQVPAQVFGRPFLKAVKRSLSPGGLAAFNFFKDRRAVGRVTRLEAVFPRVALVTSNQNLVARCRAR